MSGQYDLSPRLKMVADLVPQGARLADVGTDHAYLPTALIQEGKIPFAIAADLRQGPLASAKATVRRAGLEGKVAFRLCDGLRGIQPEEADAVAIAGMGGETIAAILAAAPLDKGTGPAPDSSANVLHAGPAYLAGGEWLPDCNRGPVL